ncbi:MAG: hypothetical protein EXR81_04995 [Gammaproteobacteria bacterium]|nr:hypothetical protein [Gammaproteobacteria bacterium]
MFGQHSTLPNLPTLITPEPIDVSDGIQNFVFAFDLDDTVFRNSSAIRSGEHYYMRDAIADLAFTMESLRAMLKQINDQIKPLRKRLFVALITHKFSVDTRILLAAYIFHEYLYHRQDASWRLKPAYINSRAGKQLYYRFEGIDEHRHYHGCFDYRTERSESAILLLHNGRYQNINKHQGLVDIAQKVYNAKPEHVGLLDDQVYNLRTICPVVSLPILIKLVAPLMHSKPLPYLLVKKGTVMATIQDIVQKDAIQRAVEGPLVALARYLHLTSVTDIAEHSEYFTEFRTGDQYLDHLAGHIYQWIMRAS